VPASVLAGLPESAPLQTEGCLARRQMTVAQPMAAWRKLGVRTVAGATLPADDAEEASLVAGVKRYFLIYPNYQAILSYNCVNAYGLSVGLLSDLSSGKPAKGAKAAKRPRPIRKKKS
jgi:membrane-bound lytic murein transglycosylase B